MASARGKRVTKSLSVHQEPEESQSPKTPVTKLGEMCDFRGVSRKKGPTTLPPVVVGSTPLTAPHRCGCVPHCHQHLKKKMKKKKPARSGNNYCGSLAS